MLFLIVGLIIQPFTYIFARFWLWMLDLQKGMVGYRKGMWATFLFSNGLFLLSYIVIRFWQPVLRVMIAWLVVLLFTLFTALTITVVYWILKKVAPNGKPQAMLRMLGVGLFVGLFGISLYNAYTPVVHHLEITLDKPLASPVRIGMVSDLHIGRMVGVRQLEKLADIMNREKVDMILTPGDIMDDDVEAYRAENMQPALMKLKLSLPRTWPSRMRKICTIDSSSPAAVSCAWRELRSNSSASNTWFSVSISCRWSASRLSTPSESSGVHIAMGMTASLFEA